MRKYKTIDQKFYPQNYVFWGFLLVYFILLIYMGDKIFIWEDEAYSLNTSSHSLPDVFSLSYEFEGQPPFYFILLAIWRFINSSIFFARLLSILIIGISAIFFQRLVSLLSEKENSFWMVVIFLLNPLTVWAALEIRLYSLVILLSIISTYYFFKFFIGNKNKDLYIMLSVLLIGLYTQYFFSFLMVSFALSLWIFKGWKDCFKFCLYSIPVVLLFLPNFIFLPDQLSMIKTSVERYTTTYRILAILFTPQDFLLAFNIIPGETLLRWIVKLPFALFIIYGFYKIYKRSLTIQSQYFRHLTILLLILFTLVVQFILFLTSLEMIFQSKYLIISFPLFAILYSIFQVFTPRTRNAIYTIVSVYFITLLTIKYTYPTKTYDFKATATFLDKIELKGEPILFYGKSTIPPFEYYYKGHNELIGLPALKYTKYYYEENINDTMELRNSIKKINTPTDSYIIVLGSIVGFNYDNQMTPDMIQSCLKASYNITLDTLIKSKNTDNSLRIQRLEKKGGY